MEWTLDQMPLGQEAVVLQIEENSMLGRRMREIDVYKRQEPVRQRLLPGRRKAADKNIFPKGLLLFRFR